MDSQDLWDAQKNPESDTANLYFRAGYLMGMAYQSTDEWEQLLLARTAGSLLQYAEKLRSETDG